MASLLPARGRRPGRGGEARSGKAAVMADMASELEAIAFRLRRAGEEDLARELTAGMRRGVEPVPGLIRAGLDPHLPKRYAETLDEDLDIRTITRNSGGADAD